MLTLQLSARVIVAGQYCLAVGTDKLMPPHLQSPFAAASQLPQICFEHQLATQSVCRFWCSNLLCCPMTCNAAVCFLDKCVVQQIHGAA